MTPDVALIFIANCIIFVLAGYFALFVYPRRPLSEETKRRPRSFISNAFFRELWYFLMNPLKKKFLEWDVSPNTITLWGFIFSVIAAPAFAVGAFGYGGWAVILASTCDVYDGMLARAKNIDLKSGAFFDSVLDRVGESAMFFGFLWYFRADFFWFVVMFLAFAASQVVSYARARAEGLGFPKAGIRGFFQRAERMIVISIGMGLTPMLEYFAPGYGVYLVYATLITLSAGSVYTAIGRGWGIYREIRATETSR